MTSAAGFRTSEEEIEMLLDECQRIRTTLKEISGQISRMENRVKRAFPDVAAKVSERQHNRNRISKKGESKPSLSPEQALTEFDNVVRIARVDPTRAEIYLLHKAPSDLVAIAQELGISFGKSKPSSKAVLEALYGKIRESILLSKHNTQRTCA